MGEVIWNANCSIINDKNHYKNLHAHIFRKSAKYKTLKFIMYPVFDDGVVHNGGIHMVVDTKFGDDVKDADVEKSLVSCLSVLSGDARMLAATVTSGENSPGNFIYPCIHALFCDISDAEMEQIYAMLNESFTKELACYGHH